MIDKNILAALLEHRPNSLTFPLFWGASCGAYHASPNSGSGITIESMKIVLKSYGTIRRCT
jgi:hypothetical protein